MVSFDPNGDDAQENEAQIWALRDRNPKTAWTTDCYANQFFGTKEYVGVLMEFSRAATGTLQVGMKMARGHLRFIQPMVLRQVASNSGVHVLAPTTTRDVVLLNL